MIKEFEALQQRIAEALIRDGVDRVITQEILQERCHHYLDVAKKKIEEIGPEPDPDRSDFMVTATVFGAQGQEARNVPVPWRDSGEKHEMMYRLGEVLKTILAQAVILRNVATTCNVEEVARRMELNMPDPRDRQKMDYFEDRMFRWIKANFGKPRIAALPPELRHDVVFSVGLGPKLKEYGASSIYRWENGKIIFDDVPEGSELHISLIPRWWE